MYSRNELSDISKNYFEKDSTLEKMHCCEDGNFFYPSQQGNADCTSHANMNKLAKFTITRGEALYSLPKKKDTIIVESSKVISESETIVEETEMGMEEARNAYKAKNGRYPSKSMSIESIKSKL